MQRPDVRLFSAQDDAADRVARDAWTCLVADRQRILHARST